MSFYDLPKDERAALVRQITTDIEHELRLHQYTKCSIYFADEDTYIRRSAYISIGRIYKAKVELRESILSTLSVLIKNDDYKIRQTVINAAGEIGKTDFTVVQHFFDAGLLDVHHSVRNAVIGSIKKMGEVNPVPVMDWAKKYLHHPDKEIRREICHGIELRGRTHPEDILPLLIELEFDTTARVKNTLVHVLGQIAYKKGCLEIVLQHLKQWKNKELVFKALDEIIDVHHRYRNFSFYTQAEARRIITTEISSAKKQPG